MGAPWKAAWLRSLSVGVGLAVGAASAWAADDPSADIALPPVPEAALVLDAAPLARSADPLALPLPPAVTVAVEPAPAVDIRLPEAPPVVVAVPAAAPASPDVTLPAPPDAAVTVTAADVLDAALAARFADPQLSLHPKLARREREAIAAFYALGNFKPLWIADGAWTARAEAVAEALKRAGEDGLEASDYPVPTLSRGGAPSALAEAELKFSAAAVLYARDARGARIEPARLSNLITPQLELPAADEILTRLASAKDPGEALAGYNPPHAGYRALKAKLAEIRAGAPAAKPVILVPHGPALKTGMRDKRVALLRARLDVGAGTDETLYDDAVAAAVAAFQRTKGLNPNGVLNRPTVAALNPVSSPARMEGDILANMERWRWLPADMGRRHIWVNVPEYKLRLIDGGRRIHEARVIVGKPETPTPLFSDEMDHAVVNPSWYVPPSIFKNEFYSDPAYAAARGYQVTRTRDGGISVRQPPGERNALGHVKFMFPNKHAVYLHDTPNRNLFGAERRAFSHGCVRLDQPFRFGEFVLGPEWTEARLRSLVGRGERTIRLPEKVPVHLTYFTATVDETGTLRQLPDLYGFNNKVRVALGQPSDGTAVAEVRPAKRQQVAREQARRRPPARPVPPAQTVVRAPAPVADPPFFWWFTR